jgi:hypothetical protein
LLKSRLLVSRLGDRAGSRSLSPAKRSPLISSDHIDAVVRGSDHMRSPIIAASGASPSNRVGVQIPASAPSVSGRTGGPSSQLQHATASVSNLFVSVIVRLPFDGYPSTVTLGPATEPRRGPRAAIPRNFKQVHTSTPPNNHRAHVSANYCVDLSGCPNEEVTGKR